jgi:hypothetical protein
MATTSLTHHTSAVHSQHTADDTFTQTPGERIFMLVAMSGAVCGAFVGSTLATTANIPEIFGLFGTLTGSVTATGLWSLVAPLASHSE